MVCAETASRRLYMIKHTTMRWSRALKCVHEKFVIDYGHEQDEHSTVPKPALATSTAVYLISSPHSTTTPQPPSDLSSTQHPTACRLAHPPPSPPHLSPPVKRKSPPTLLLPHNGAPFVLAHPQRQSPRLLRGADAVSQCYRVEPRSGVHGTAYLPSVGRCGSGNMCMDLRHD